MRTNAALRRYEAAGWLRKTVGVVAAKDLPAEPSEEDFRLGLRSGIVLCNVLNKIQPGAVQKVGVYEAPLVQHFIYNQFQLVIDLVLLWFIR